MSRNLYLGADVGVALDLLPDMPTAAQFMWDQVQTTGFDTRVHLLAAEVVEANPDVIGLQEATTWSCRPSTFESAQVVLDFTAQLLDATSAAGADYVIAAQAGSSALNPGYTIPPIPRLTRVHDPATFQPRFGQDSADCGFTIADALLVRSDLAGSVVAAGTGEYETRYPVVPVVFTIDRGYSWADLDLGGTNVRVATTHLESLWDPGKPVPAADQARQLVSDLAGTTAPLVVMGDFNADPRDPRTAVSGTPGNPGGQPEASDACPAQPQQSSPGEPSLADDTCNAYWVMRKAGYAEAGPDPLDPANLSWGAAGDLAGPDATRLAAALAMDNDAGFTDRLDHVFVANGAEVVSSRMIGDRWPGGSGTWRCDDPSQIATTRAASEVLVRHGLLDAPITDHGVCLPTDHAGVVAVIDVTAGKGVPAGAEPPQHDSKRIDLLGWLAIIATALLILLVSLLWLVVALVRRWRRRRRLTAAPASGPGGPDAAPPGSEART